MQKFKQNCYQWKANYGSEIDYYANFYFTPVPTTVLYFLPKSSISVVEKTHVLFPGYGLHAGTIQGSE